MHRDGECTEGIYPFTMLCPVAFFSPMFIAMYDVSALALLNCSFVLSSAYLIILLVKNVLIGLSSVLFLGAYWDHRLKVPIELDLGAL